MLHIFFFGDVPMLPFDPALLNMENITTVLKYVGTFDRNNMSLNPAVGCKYFTGDAGLILDDILCEIKVSLQSGPFKNRTYQV